MEPESGAAAAAASAGTFIPLNEHEQRLYSGLHALCQADPTGKLSSCKVATLLTASQLPPESLHKVTDVCGAKRLGYFGLPQFYTSLKLVAAAQSGRPIRLDSVTTNLPLPRFVGLKNEPELQYSFLPPGGADGPGVPCGSGPGSSSWTPAADRGTFRPLETNPDNKESWSPPRSPPRSPQMYHSSQYDQQRNGLDSHTNKQQHSPRKYGSPAPMEHPANAKLQLLANTKLEYPANAQAWSGERGEQQDEDPWTMTEEQLDYYTLQFQSLQPDLSAFILGAVAKHFFTKSKLPIPELSHIWELSDVDRDGALTFTEFCTAFHLIVARKNGYPLPESLPPSLQPRLPQPEDDAPDTPESPEALSVFEDEESRPGNARPLGERLHRRSTSTTQDVKEASSQRDAASIRVGGATQNATLQLPAFPERPEPPQDLDPPHWRMKTRPRSYSSTSIEDVMKKAEEPPTPPPRPQKTHSRASSLDLNKLFQQGTPGGKSEKSEERPLCSTFGASAEDLTVPSTKDAAAGSHSEPPQKPVRRKYHPDSQHPDAAVPFPPPSPPPPPTKLPQKLLSKQKREIQMAIRKNKETNAVLTRLNSELQQQLKVAHQERLTLESQLELLRPLTST